MATERQNAPVSDPAEATADEPRLASTTDVDTTIETESDATESNAADPGGWTSALKNYWWLIPLVALLVAIAGLTFLRTREPSESEAGAGADSTEETQTQVNPVSVRTAPVQTAAVRSWVTNEGLVQAEQFRHLTFDTSGEVTYIAPGQDGGELREGERVQAGQLLAQIDDRQLQADLRQAEAALVEAREQEAAAQAQVAQARSQVQEAQSQVNRAQSNLDLAQSQLNRYQFLYSEGAVPASEIDTRRNAVDDARASLQTARSRVTSAEEQVDAAQQQLDAARARVDNARARVNQAEVALEDTRIYAPFDGVVAYLNIREGEQFTPQIVTSQLARDYQEIVEAVPIVVIDPSQFEVMVDLPSESGSEVQTGQSAYVVPEQNPAVNTASAAADMSQTLIEQARAQGEVVAVNPAVSPGGRAIEATVDITQGGNRLQHGARVPTWIAVESAEDAVVVPLNAVVYRDQVPYIFALNEQDNTVDQRQVELGITGLRQQQILSGVAPDEQVVTEGHNRLVEGTPVRLVNQPEQGQMLE
jgi:RND family efflux transporter MFP subunit